MRARPHRSSGTKFAAALDATESFFWSGFADNYIELAKRRARDEDDPAGRASAIATLRLGLSVCLRLFAPFVPSITDEGVVLGIRRGDGEGFGGIYLAGPRRRNLIAWRGGSDASTFRAACDAIGAVRKAKSERSIGLGKPLASLSISASPELLERLRPGLPDVLSAAGASSAELAPVSSVNGEAPYSAEIEPLVDAGRV